MWAARSRVYDCPWLQYGVIITLIVSLFFILNTMKKINWWRIAYEVIKVVLLSLAGGAGANTLLG